MRARQRSHHRLNAKMAPTEKAQQELEEIERQVAELASNGDDDSTRRQIAKLQDRIETLRRQDVYKRQF